jgi:hypothetical protein
VKTLGSEKHPTTSPHTFTQHISHNPLRNVLQTASYIQQSSSYIIALLPPKQRHELTFSRWHLQRHPSYLTPCILSCILRPPSPSILIPTSAYPIRSIRAAHLYTQVQYPQQNPLCNIPVMSLCAQLTISLNIKTHDSQTRNCATNPSTLPAHKPANKREKEIASSPAAGNCQNKKSQDILTRETPVPPKRKRKERKVPTLQCYYHLDLSICTIPLPSPPRGTGK